MKTPKLSTAVVSILFIVGSLSFTNTTQAQDTTFTIQQAVELAKENYPAIKSARLEIDKQKTLKSTAWDLGNTSIYTGKEEVGNGALGIHNQIGIDQSGIDVFGVFAKNKLANIRTEQAVSALNLTEFIVLRDVRSAWYKVLYAKQQWELFKQLDSLYANFQKAAELRFKTQQTSKIEFLSASAKYKALQVNIKKAESIYLASLQILNQYLLFPGKFNINVSNMETEIYTILQVKDSLSDSPVLSYYSYATSVAENEWKAERTSYFPKIDLGYVKQAVDGNSGYSGWQVGVSVPLLFFSQSGKTKAARLDFEIAGQQFAQKQVEINAEYNQLISRYLVLVELINYYKKEALPLADEQIQAANLAYNLGSIDYVQFIQNIESAINTKQEYLIQKAEYFELSAQLKYITGK